MRLVLMIANACAQVLLELADDFLENLISGGSMLARHRGADTLEVRDVAVHLERSWDMRIPGYVRSPFCEWTASNSGLLT